MKEMLYAVWCLKSNEDMILALAGQFKQLSRKPDSMGFEPMTSAMPVQCSYQLSYEVTWWRAGQFVGVMGSNPVESPEFFRFMRQLLKFSSKCEDHIFI